MKKILVLRSGGVDVVAEAPLDADVVILRTHDILPNPKGIAEAIRFDAAGAVLVVSSKETVRVLCEEEERHRLFRAPFAEMLAVGEGTGELLRKVIREAGGAAVSGPAQNDSGARGTRSSEVSSEAPEALPRVVVPDEPGAAGVLHLLRRKKKNLSSLRILWPRGSDAALGPLDELRRLPAEVTAPIVYEKVPRAPSSFSPLEESSLGSFFSGGFSAVAVGSLSALDVLLGLAAARGAALPQVRWGVLGPETARAFEARGLPRPIVPSRPRLAELIALLRSEKTP